MAAQFIGLWRTERLRRRGLDGRMLQRRGRGERRGSRRKTKGNITAKARGSQREPKDAEKT